MLSARGVAKPSAKGGVAPPGKSRPGPLSVSVPSGTEPPPPLVQDPFRVVPPRRASQNDLGTAQYGGDGRGGQGGLLRRSSQGGLPVGAQSPHAPWGPIPWGSTSGGVTRVAAAGSTAWGGGSPQQQRQRQQQPQQFQEKESEGRSADCAGAQQPPLELPQRRTPGGLRSPASLQRHGAALAGAGSGGATVGR